MAKFKVGDKVRIVRRHFTWDINGRMDKWLGKVMTIRAIAGDDYHMEEDISENSGRGWYWNEDSLKKFDEKQRKILILADGTTTTARLYEGKKLVRTAEAKCSPKDTYSFEAGAKLAFERLLGEKEVEVYYYFPCKDCEHVEHITVCQKKCALSGLVNAEGICPKKEPTTAEKLLWLAENKMQVTCFNTNYRKSISVKSVIGKEADVFIRSTIDECVDAAYDWARKDKQMRLQLGKKLDELAAESGKEDK